MRSLNECERASLGRLLVFEEPVEVVGVGGGEGDVGVGGDEAEDDVGSFAEVEVVAACGEWFGPDGDW